MGLDVGGTNTDAVLMDGDTIRSWNKRPTSPDVSTGIVSALSDLLSETGIAPSMIRAVMIGTTHFTNAVVERRRLGSVFAVRACLPSNTAIPIAFDWPSDLTSAIQLRTRMIRGGTDFDGRPIATIDEGELDDLAREIEQTSSEAVAITSVFAPMDNGMELAIAEGLRHRIPGISLSLSHSIGRIGLIERENATILNAALLGLAATTFSAFRSAIDELQIDAPLFISQNDGTVSPADLAAQYPIRTLSSGPTNSMRGAAFLTGLSRAVVLDIGGTTSDVGALIDGFPRQAPLAHSISGVRTNFRMPEVDSIGIGGGSIVRDDGATTQVGPDSVGYEIRTRARVFGGDQLTATDVAAAVGLAKVGDTSAVGTLDPRVAERAITAWHSDIENLLTEARPGPEEIPVILVGGGSILVDPERICSFSEFSRPEFFQVANAVGAAIPQVSAEIDRIVHFTDANRAEVLDAIRREVIHDAVANGARPSTVEVLDEDILNVPSLDGEAARVRVRAVGTLELDA